MSFKITSYDYNIDQIVSVYDHKNIVHYCIIDEIHILCMWMKEITKRKDAAHINNI